jgi:hypothetical protein
LIRSGCLCPVIIYAGREDSNDMDTKYDAEIKKIKDEAAAKAKEEKEKKEKELKAEYLETGMTKEEYVTYKAGGDEALKKFQKAKANAEWLENQVKIRERKITALRMDILAKEEEISELKKPDGEAQDAA